MTERFISSLHINKLGHEILEIRQRALFNIISKLDHGFVYDNDLARSKEILKKLFEWFLFEQCAKEDVVLKLIKRILQTESGDILIQRLGNKSIWCELERLKSYIDPKYYPLVDDLLNLVNAKVVDNNIVPPLQSDIPLSYRTGQSNTTNRTNLVESTASSITGILQKDASIEQQTENVPEFASNSNEYNTQPNYTFTWQHLVLPDMHVLESVEESLRNPPQSAVLLHSCEFFSEVMLQDFPAEVFLQRPAIVLQLKQVLNTCPSTRVCNAVLNSLLKLVGCLKIRINYYNDPSMHCNKQIVLDNLRSGFASSISPSENSTGPELKKSSLRDEIETTEESVRLMKTQMSLPKFCFHIIQSVFCYLKPDREVSCRKTIVGINVSIILLNEICSLLEICIKPEFFDQSEIILQQEFNSILYNFAEVLEYLRLEVATDDLDMLKRVVHLQLLHICADILKGLIPLDKANEVLPHNFKSVLCNSLLDVTLAQLYPSIQEVFIEYVKRFTERVDFLEKYKMVKSLCESMTSAKKLLQKYKSYSTIEVIFLAKEAFLSLTLHKNLKFIKIFVDVCANKLPMQPFNDDLYKAVEDILLGLLSHDVTEIRVETYRLCQKRVIVAIGPKLNRTGSGVPGSQVMFLLQSRVLNEIALHGMTDDVLEVQKHAEDILVLILKCKILVSDEIWNKAVEALIPSLPSLFCHLGKSSCLGRTLLNVLDPDTAESFCFPKLEILRGNARILFTKDSTVRNEAISRLCWMLSLQPDSNHFLPRINNLHNKGLGFVCLLECLVDINKSRSVQHFYQPSSLQQVLDLLNSPNTEPVIRRSALTQVSVMMEDVLLHRVFLDNGGLTAIIEILKVALTEQDFRDYPDSVIPIISVLKNICLYSHSVRQELSNDLELYYWILRGLFLFCAEDRLKHDASILLFLLLFNDFISGSPSNNDFALPDLLIKNLNVPFTCHVQADKLTNQNIKDIITDAFSLSCLQIHWNSEWYDGFNNILSWDEVKYTEQDLFEFDKLLRLKNYDLFMLKCSSLRYCIKKYLDEVDGGLSHLSVLDALNKLSSYIFLFNMSKGSNDFNCDSLLSLPWEKTFARFLNVLPSCEDDVILLIHVIKFLCVLVPFYKKSEKACWISEILKNPTHCLHDLLQSNSNDNDAKTLSQELLNLIKICVCQEQHFIDFHMTSHIKIIENSTSSWKCLIEVISNNLKFSDAQHFYNLAYLDCLLSCLVHLTATLGWTQSKTGIARPEQLQQLVCGLCELVGSFHCGKGPSASISMMGLGITRNVMLVLNHLLVEVQIANIKGWEMFFLAEDVNGENTVTSLCTLWHSRDVVLRAAVWQLFAGICTKLKTATELIQKTKEVKIRILEMAVMTVLDHDEASIVRENAAMLLANLISHMRIISSDISNSNLKKKKNTLGEIFTLLNDYNFYKELEIILSNLYIYSVFIFKLNDYKNENLSNLTGFKSECSLVNSKNYKLCTLNSLTSKSSSSERFPTVATPGFIKAITLFVYNLLNVSADEVALSLQENGLIKMFFRTICIPSFDIINTKELGLYCDILEMNAIVCSLLNKTVSNNNVCLGTVLHTKDCLNILLSLLDPNLFYTDLPQLLYLRNRLWVEVFNLIASLLECSVFDEKVSFSRSSDALLAISNALNECGRQPFLLTLCEAISSSSSFDLQHSALTSLTSLLQIEAYCSEDDIKVSESGSMQNLLDYTKTPRSSSVQENLSSSLENIRLKPSDKTVDVLWDKKTVKNKSKMNLLQEVYFGTKSLSKLHTNNCALKMGSDSEPLMAGAELCKILLQLFDLSNLNDDRMSKKRPIIIMALSSILCVSYEAKKYALENGLLEMALHQLKELHIKLSLESIECLRRVSDKKRVCPILKELNSIIGLLTNFMLGDKKIKKAASILGLADLTHKLWIWFYVQNSYLIDALKMLCTYTSNSFEACQSLLFTSAVAGSGPRKAPSNVSLLHAAFNVITKEMDQISRTHDLTVLQLSFQLLHNASVTIECRVLLSKSNLFQCLSRLHPAITKRQKPWESVELLWLEFLQTFSGHPEGQACINKVPDALEIIMALTSSQNQENRRVALLVLRNVAFYQPNRPRLLSSDDFLSILQTKLSGGSVEEKNVVVTIMWALAANSQKAKLVLKCAQLDVKLQEAIKRYHLMSEIDTDPNNIERMHFVLNMIRDGEKIR